MSNRIRPALIALIAVALSKGSVQAQTAADSAAIRAAALDYIEGFYQGDSTRHIRSVRPEVSKVGFSRNRETGVYTRSVMPWTGFHAYANGVKSGRNTTPAGAPKDVKLLDVSDQTAAAKVTAWWGIDYLHMAKHDGRWQIVHVLWQSPPR
jgi:hypothetical protein